MPGLRGDRRNAGNTSTGGGSVDWRSSAACAAIGDPEVFFPLGRQGRRRLAGDGVDLAEPAKTVCRRCPAVRDCLRYALGNDVQGVWGGTTYEEREQLREQYGITAEPITTVRLLSEVDRLHQVAELDRGGHSAAEVAAQLNTTPRTVQRMRALNRGYQHDRIA